MKRYVFLFALVLWVAASQAQQWKNYTNMENVNCIALDADTVWVGSTGGVAKLLLNGTKLANYTHADGLADNHVNAIAIDSNGNKWFGTGRWFSASNSSPGGLSKFDGSAWITYSTSNSVIPGNKITNVLTAPDGNIWIIAKDSGVARFDGSAWTVYKTSNSTLPSNRVTGLTLDTFGNVWTFAGAGVKFDGVNWISTPAIQNVNGAFGNIAFDHNNNLWASFYYVTPGTYSSILKYNGIGWTNYTSVDYGNFNPLAIAVDADNNVWFGRKGARSLLKFDGSNFTSFVSNHASMGNSLAIDYVGNKWLATDKGVCRYNDISWDSFNPSFSGISHSSVGQILADRHGHKWIGNYPNTDVSNFTRFNMQGWDTLAAFAVPGEVNHFAVGLLQTDHSNLLWMLGFYGGPIYSFDGTNWTTVYLPNTFTGQIYDMTIDIYSNKWVATNKGIYKFDGNSWTVFNQANSGLLNDHVSSITADKYGNIWCGTYPGISKFDGNSWIRYTASNSGIMDSINVYILKVDALNNIWMGHTKGLTKFDTNNNWTNYTSSNSGVPQGIIWSLYPDKNSHIWCSSNYDYGVTKFDGTSWVEYVPANSGIGNSEVNFITQDNQGNMWFGTGCGISELLSTDSIYSTWLQFSENICADNTIHLNPIVNYGTPPYTYAWQGTGNALSCANCQNPTATITQNSVYTVLVTDANNRVTADTLHVYACLNTAVNEVENEIAASIYPNPATGMLYVETGDKNALTLNIYDLQGRLAISFNHPTTQANDISHLANGLYVAEILTSAGTARKRLVKM